ncbi:MAG: hypothetical protein IPI67_16030 [Myxococcales bacterium]|nr:hypothetical protein [Myxococcales bacterium]
MSTGIVQLFCEHCQVYRAPHETRLAGPAQAAIAVCASCGGALRKEAQRVTRPLSAELLRAFVYPARPAVAFSLAVTALVSGFLRFVPLIGGLLSATLVIGYIFMVLRASAEGRDDLAVDTDIAGGLSVWMGPLVRYLLTFLVAFAPALAVLIGMGWAAGAPLVIAAAALGVLYLPAGMIIAAHGDGCLSPLYPVPAVQLIFRIPLPYLITLAFLCLSLATGAALTWVVARLLGEVPVLGGLLIRSVGLLGPVVMARQLGVLVHEHGEEL